MTCLSKTRSGAFFATEAAKQRDKILTYPTVLAGQPKGGIFPLSCLNSSSSSFIHC